MKLVNKNTHICKIGLCKIGLLCYLLLSFGICMAQTRLSEQDLMARFIEVNNAYRKQPVHIKISISDSTNLAMGNTATSHRYIECYSYPEGSLTRMGNIDQLANDSVLIFIRNNIKTITVYPQTQPNNGTAVTGLKILDIKKMLKNYTIALMPVQQNDGGYNTLNVSSKEELSMADIPAHSMQLTYSVQTGMPVQAAQIMRSLVKIDSSAYVIMSRDTLNKAILVAANDGLHYVVLEKIQVYHYDIIDENHKSPLPLTVADCIIKKQSGRFVPSKQYEAYTLKQPFNP